MSLTPIEMERLADLIAERLTRCTSDAFMDSIQAAEILGCSVPTVERLTKAGAIPSVKVGRLRRYRRSELLALAKEKGGADHGK